MTGYTHRQYSICFAFLAAMLLYRLDISNINYYLTIPIMLMTSKCGALFPDIDHAWDNVHDKTVLNKIINKIIHITKGKHRSWQTHSIDICVYFTATSYLLPDILFDKGVISEVNKEAMMLLMLGFSSGWISHIISDMLTSAGVRLICFSTFKIRLVPKKIGRLRFNTGNEWEKFNFKVVRFINMVLGVVCIIYPYILNGKLPSFR